MGHSFKSFAFSIAAVAILGVSATSAQAQTVRVKCDARDNQSTASVDGRNLAAGLYSTTLESGPNMAQSQQVAAVQGEIETDYSSKQRDVRRGATKIDADFIVKNKVTGSLLDADGNVLDSQTVKCRH